MIDNKMIEVKSAGTSGNRDLIQGEEDLVAEMKSFIIIRDTSFFLFLNHFIADIYLFTCYKS